MLGLALVSLADSDGSLFVLHTVGSPLCSDYNDYLQLTIMWADTGDIVVNRYS